jgi:soluble lytic murein transglycosylase-like protein
MPQTASWHGLADPFNPVEALRRSASYLRELRDQFGNPTFSFFATWPCK